jgi:hypothetical protein
MGARQALCVTRPRHLLGRSEFKLEILSSSGSEKVGQCPTHAYHRVDFSCPLDQSLGRVVSTSRFCVQFLSWVGFCVKNLVYARPVFKIQL